MSFPMINRFPTVSYMNTYSKIILCSMCMLDSHMLFFHIKWHVAHKVCEFLSQLIGDYSQICKSDFNLLQYFFVPTFVFQTQSSTFTSSVYANAITQWSTEY